jgi:hypothetical protein
MRKVYRPTVVYGMIFVARLGSASAIAPPQFFEEEIAKNELRKEKLRKEMTNRK